MNAPFPFGFPAATGMYLALYVVTLGLHVVFISYVLAGSCFLGIGALTGRARGDRLVEGTVEHTLYDWLPFAVGLAITAGVAPLLFLQLLYMHRFYSANLLLFHRWMLIVPALIVGFYLLYLLKSDRARTRPWLWRLAAVGAFTCFAFVAWSWTENHLLSSDRGAWVATYSSGHWVYRSRATLPRLLMWFCGSLAVMGWAVAWQLRVARARGIDVAPSEAARLSRVALAGLALGLAAAGVYAAVAPGNVRAAVTGPLCLPYTVATVAGGLVQLGGWMAVRRAGLERGPLWAVTAGVVVAVLGSGVMRESVRLGAVDIAELYPDHARAAASGGLGLFVLFLLLNGGLVAFAVLLGLRAAGRTSG